MFCVLCFVFYVPRTKTKIHNQAGIPVFVSGGGVVVVGWWWWWWITYPLLYNTSPRLGAGALMLNAWTGLLQYL